MDGNAHDGFTRDSCSMPEVLLKPVVIALKTIMAAATAAIVWWIGADIVTSSS